MNEDAKAMYERAIQLAYREGLARGFLWGLLIALGLYDLISFFTH